MEILISKDSKGKIRVVEIDLNYSDKVKGFCISRTTYQYGGKRTEQPEIWIYEGKVKRTIKEQADLQYNSNKKKYLDKGYKLIPNELISDKKKLEEFVEDEMGDGISDSNGFKKHMLAKPADKVATSAFDKPKYWLASRKLDGVRNSFYLYQEDGSIKTASRGGKEYDISASKLACHPITIQIFQKYPDIVLDGELYCHGKSLQQISGACRKQEPCTWMQYFIYDIMDDTKTAQERVDFLEQLAEEFNIPFDVELEGNQIQMLPQEVVSGWQGIKKLHDKYVGDGFEGVVIRNPDGKYKYGGRGNEMIKVKEYKDAEFEITGFSEGLREEDMVFDLITEDGKPFQAKPFGSRELKQQYRRDMKDLIGKKATVKFFAYSEDGVPTQTNLKCIRDYE